MFDEGLFSIVDEVLEGCKYLAEFEFVLEVPPTEDDIVLVFETETP